MIEGFRSVHMPCCGKRKHFGAICGALENASFRTSPGLPVAVAERREPMTRKADASAFLFTPFADILLDDGDVPALLDYYRRESDVDLGFRDALDKRLWVSAHSDIFRENVKIYPLRELLRLYHTMEVRIRDMSAGVIIFDIPRVESPHPSPVPGILAEHLRIALTFYMERVLSRRQAELGQRDEFLRDLFHGRMPDAETAMEKARSFGWDLGGALLVVVARLSDESGTGADPLSVQAVVQLTRSRLRAFFPKTVYTVMTKDLVFLVPFASDEPSKNRIRENILSFALSLREEFSREFGLSVAVAAGGRAKDVMDVPRSYEEALHVAGVQPAVFPGEAAVFWESIGEYRILSLMSQNQEAERLCADVLGPLIDDSAPSSRDLLETLRMLDACNWNVRDVSGRMRFHYNTIKYRSARIREILKIDPDDAAVRFRIGLALRLLELLPDTMRFVKK